MKTGTMCMLAAAAFLLVAGCGGKSGDNNNNVGTDGQVAPDASGQDAGVPPDAAPQPDAAPPIDDCNNGIQDGDETGHDCGGSCANQDCCSNGYADVGLGETGVDCGGPCGACVYSTYFVSNTGNDTHAGTAPNQAWATIERVNQVTLQPGDAVLFERGGTWRDTLLVADSGTDSAYITYGAYGMGPKPRILGSARAEGWTEVQTNIWETTNTFRIPESPGYGSHAASIFFGETGGSVTWGNMEEIHLNSENAPIGVYQCDEQGARFSLLDREYDWCWEADRIYVYAPDNPGTRYAFVEVPQRDTAIVMDTHPPAEHITVDGLELLFGIKYGINDGWPMSVQVRGLRVLHNHIGWLGVKGAPAAYGLQVWHSDMLVRDNVIHDCGRRSVSYNVYVDQRSSPLTFENVTFEHNVLHSGYHTTGFDVNAGYADTFQNFVFRGNYLWDDPNDDPQDWPNDFTSMGYFINAGPATFTGFKFYNNVFSYTKQKGLVLNGVSNTEVFNNTFYGLNERAGGGYRGMIHVSESASNLRIENNIFYGTVDPADLVLQCVVFGGSTEDGATLNRNLYYHLFGSQRIVTLGSGPSYTMGDWLDYRSATGWDTDSPTPGDPLFVDAPNGDFRLQAGSPAIDNGAPEPDRSSDHNGDPLVGTPDIGAFEYQEP